jgi:hypothetical protein
MKLGMIALTAALLMLAVPAWGGPTDPCAGSPDSDNDGTCDAADNCKDIKNSGVFGCDTDNDGYGNACDGDYDQGGSVNSNDFVDFFLPDFSASSDVTGTGTDHDCGGSVNSNDFVDGFLPLFSNSANGASGLKCAGTADCGDKAQNEDNADSSE